ncbi:MAG: hypothetical protein RIC36_13255 [Rhodospirillales bacterium]
MWRPPERIRFEPAPGRWPTAEEASAAKLFSPVAVGRTELATRTWVPAMVPWRATGDGFVSDDVLDWYGRFARGRPGAIVVEATGIRDIPSGPLLRIGDDRFIPGLRKLVERVREESHGETRLLIQLIDFLSIRRRPDPVKFFDRFLVITDRHRSALQAADRTDAEIREQLKTLSDAELDKVLTDRELDSLRMGDRERVTDTHLPHIANLPDVLPELFAAAAVRAQQAGFDGVELHYAHAYTMASFLSAKNDRADGYGGPREQRVRLPLEVFAAVRKAVGDDYPAGCRYLADEAIDGGNSPEDAAWFGAEFARAGMDFLSLSRGGKFDDAKQPGIGQAAYPYTGPSGYECMPSYFSDEHGPFGRNVEATALVRDAVRKTGSDIPIVVAGGMHGFEQAEELLTSGKADIIGSARQTLADPDWFLKMRLGLGRDVRVCEYTNYCEGLDQKHKQVTCKLWDRLDLDTPDVPMTEDGKRRMIAPDWQPGEG